MTADVTPTPIALAVGKRLPLDIAVQLLSAGDGSNGAISFEMGCVLMKLERPTQQEIKDFSGKASVRVGDFGSFMLFSPSFKGFSFDLLWSPVIARAQDKPGLVAEDAGKHLLLNFILSDEHAVVRGIRTATISPEQTEYVSSLQHNLMGRDVDGYQVNADMMRLFSQHPHGLPDSAFQSISPLGA